MEQNDDDDQRETKVTETPRESPGKVTGPLKAFLFLFLSASQPEGFGNICFFTPSYLLDILPWYTVYDSICVGDGSNYSIMCMIDIL